MKPAAEKHLEEAAAFIAVAESGDAKQAAYRRAAEKIEAAREADPDLSFREIGRRLGKDQHYGRRLLNALVRARTTGEFRIDWERKDRDQVGAEKIAREQPQAFAGAYQQAPPEVRRQIAKQIAADPFVRQEVSRRDARERMRQLEEASRNREAGAMPLPAYMARMVRKMNDWALGLAAITDEDLDGLPDGPARDRVVDAAAELENQAHRFVVRLRRAPNLTVLEGRATVTR